MLGFTGPLWLALGSRAAFGVPQPLLQRGEVVGGPQALPQVKDGPLPLLPQPRMGSPALWCTAVLTPHRVHPRVSATPWLPHGRGRHTALRAMVSHLHARHHGLPTPPWVDAPTWIVAVDYDSGQRVVFGRGGAPAAPLPDAVGAPAPSPAGTGRPRSAAAATSTAGSGR